MDSRLVVVVHPTQDLTRVLAMEAREEILRASLGPPWQAHRWAAPQLLEALALWHQQPLRVVLYAESDRPSYALGLCDDFGFGQKTLHYEVDVVEVEAQRRGEQLGAAADFRNLRQLGLRRCL